MKKLSLYSLLIGFVGLLVSCSRTESTQTLEELTRNSRAVPRRVLPVDVLLAGPYQIQYLDGYLLWVDKVKEKLLAIYNLQTDRTVVQLVNEGKGPNEIMPPLQLLVDPQQKTVGLLQRQTNQYTEYRFEDMLRDNLVRTNRFNFDKGADMCVKSALDRFVFADIFLDTLASAGVCDTLGNVVRWIDTFPAEILELSDPTDRYIKGQSQMAYNARHQVLFLAYAYLDRVQFYDFSGPTPVLIREIGVPGLDKEYTPRVLQVYSTEDYVYVLRVEYPGKKRYIIKFNCEGDVDDCIEAGNQAYRFCVTPDDTKIYTLEQDSAAMPVVAEYRLR